MMAVIYTGFTMFMLGLSAIQTNGLLLQGAIYNEWRRQCKRT